VAELLLLLLLGAEQTCTARIIPRSDGALVELRSEIPFAPAASVSGFTLVISAGLPLEGCEGGSYWILGAEVDGEDGRLTISMDTTVALVSHSLSADGLTFLAFLRSSRVFVLPVAAWAGPPVEPPPLQLEHPDSLAFASLTAGEPVPWLEDFDCVVLDPGHGGRDPGAVGPSGTEEKDRNLEIALLVRDILAVCRPDVRVVLTREEDCYMTLWDRTRLANAERADLFVSIHCNASTSPEAHGFETFFLSLARTDDARAVAALENGVAEFEGIDPESALDPLVFLLADMAQNLYQTQSGSLAELVQGELASSFPERRDRGVKQAGFYVLRGAWMPSVLVETAFISNPSEERMLSSLDFRFAAARAIVAGIEAFSMNGGDR
jgi:N-acetylmuramoyl-L-alanine amidase